jgi:hypothetical protein
MSLKKFSGGTRSLPPPARFINSLSGVVLTTALWSAGMRK